MNQFTILGATGFIGSHLAQELGLRGWSVFTPSRLDDLSLENLGTVYYCIGLTADFRTRPFETVEAHVTKLAYVLGKCRFDLLVYLSSTRLYACCDSPAHEETALRFQPAQHGDLYNLTKATGECLALSSGRSVRIARLSNVYGPDKESANFLTSLIRSALRDRIVTLETTPQSVKDYIHVDDVVDALIHIGLGSKENVYNIASGRNISNDDLTNCLANLTGASFQTSPDARTVSFPQISVGRLQSEFSFIPRCLFAALPEIVKTYLQFREDMV